MCNITFNKLLFYKNFKIIEFLYKEIEKIINILYIKNKVYNIGEAYKDLYN